MNKKSLLTFGISLALFFIAPLVIFAAESEAAQPRFIIPELQIDLPGFELASISSVEDGVPWIAQYVAFMYAYGFNIAALFAAVIVMAGGAVWLTASGNDNRISKAKELIAGGLSGLILIAAAYVLLAQINPKLVDFKGLSPEVIARDTVYAASPGSSSACVMELNDGEFPGGSGEPIISKPGGTASPGQSPAPASLTGSQACSTKKGGYKKNGLYFAGIGPDFSLTRPTDPRIYCPAANRNASAQEFKRKFYYQPNDDRTVKALKKKLLTNEILLIALSFQKADAERNREITSYNCAYPNNGVIASHDYIVQQCPTEKGPGIKSTVRTYNSIQLFDCGGWVGYVYSCAGLGVPVGPNSNETTFDIALHQPEATKSKILATKSANFSKEIASVQPGEFFGITKAHAMLKGYGDEFYECGHNQNTAESTGCVRKSLMKDFNERYKYSQNVLITFTLDDIVEKTFKNFYQ